MVRENEILSLLFGAGVLHFIILKHAELKQNPTIRLLIPSFCLFFLACAIDVVESFFWRDACVLLKHILYLSSALVLFAWAWRLPYRNQKP